MSKREIGQWVTAATNLAVLVGVVLVIVELRQNAGIARLELMEARRASMEQFEAAFIDPELSAIWVKSVMDPSSMDLAEIRAMDSYLTNHLYQALLVYDMEQAGLMETGSTVAYMEADFPYVFGSRFAKAWWTHEGQTWDTEVVELAMPIVESVPDDLLQDRYSRMQQTFS